jgi:hypothetical protein
MSGKQPQCNLNGEKGIIMMQKQLNSGGLVSDHHDDCNASQPGMALVDEGRLSGGGPGLHAAAVSLQAWHDDGRGGALGQWYFFLRLGIGVYERVYTVTGMVNLKFVQVSYPQGLPSTPSSERGQRKIIMIHRD